MTTIKLKFPLTVNGAPVTQVNLRRPKVRDMRAAQKAGGSNADVEIRLLTNLCELAPSDFDDMDVVDYLKIQKAYEGFLSLK